MADIFISYAREDRDYARSLAEICLGRGWTVWWDRKIPVGKSFSDVIESELQAARSVIVVWSSRSVTSEWVQNEAADAAERRILIPVLVEDVRIPLEFRRIQAAKLVGWKPGDNQPELDDLFSSLAAMLGLPGSQAGGPVGGQAVAVQSRIPIEPPAVLAEAPPAPLGAAATTVASLSPENPPIAAPAVLSTPITDEGVQDATTSVEAAAGFEPANARRPFSLRAMLVIVAVAAAGILLTVTVLRPSGTRSVIRPEDTGPVPHYDQTNSLDLTRAKFQIGIVDGVGEKLHLVNSMDNLTERDVAGARLTQQDGTAISLTFSPTGAAKMKALTTSNVGKQMGFMRNGEVVFHAVIDGPFSSDGQISFSSPSEAKEFFVKLQGGRN